jgi:NTP pyrophosphatase (non-canonical NTP hydrolase)
MQFEELQQRALEVRKKYEAFEKRNTGSPWTNQEIVEGLVGDVGDLMKLVMAKEGRRNIEGDLDKKLGHELSDCLWVIFVLANKYRINLPEAFETTMKTIEKRIK